MENLTLFSFILIWILLAKLTFDVNQLTLKKIAYIDGNFSTEAVNNRTYTIEYGKKFAEAPRVLFSVTYVCNYGSLQKSTFSHFGEEIILEMDPCPHYRSYYVGKFEENTELVIKEISVTNFTFYVPQIIRHSYTIKWYAIGYVDGY